MFNGRQLLISRVIGVRPGKLLKMIVWRGGTRSDRASHRAQPTRQSGEVTNCSGALGKMYPRSQERHRNREATVYLPALGGDGPRLDRMIRIFKCSPASSREESLKCCAALLAVRTEASGFSVMGNQHCRR